MVITGVLYCHRTSVDPTQPVSRAKSEQTHGQGEKFIPTGQTFIGLPVYDTPGYLAFERQRDVVPTLLCLKKPDGKFIIYSLSDP